MSPAARLSASWRHFARGVPQRQACAPALALLRVSLPGERRAVEVKIGIQSVPRELVVDTNSSFEEVEHALEAAVSEGAVFTLADDKGGKVMVPADKIAYLEVGGTGTRRIGFGNTL
jgi:hypothetical protein